MTDAMVSRAEYLRMQAVADEQHAKHMNALIERDIAIEHARVLRDHLPVWHIKEKFKYCAAGCMEDWPCDKWTRASEALDD